MFISSDFIEFLAIGQINHLLFRLLLGNQNFYWLSVISDGLGNVVLIDDRQMILFMGILDDIFG